jgi:superfamily II DNA/RNA helicase
MQGKVDIDAMKAISPNSFDGVADDQVEAVAKNLQNSIGIMKASAVQRIINSHSDNAKINRMSQLVAERKGKQGVVFAHGRADVEAITKRLTAEGKRVVTITGSDSAEDKDRKRKMFNPEKGEAQADILVASDAGAVGMNLQSGQYLIQHDIPNTAKTHAQRNARIDRIGQKNNIELIDMQANHPEESRARERLTTKYGLRDMMTSSMDGLDDTGVAYHIAQQQAINKDSQNSLF